jgi:hypothetical protein
MYVQASCCYRNDRVVAGIALPSSTRPSLCRPARAPEIDTHLVVDASTVTDDAREAVWV